MQLLKPWLFEAKYNYIGKISKRHKLDDISFTSLTIRCLEDPVISVQYIHGSEIRASYTDYYNGDRQGGGVHNGWPSVIHVWDYSIRYY